MRSVSHNLNRYLCTALCLTKLPCCLGLIVSHCVDPVPQLMQQAGKLWFPDSAYKTAQSIKDFNREQLPLMIFPNWRGFSGGMKGERPPPTPTPSPAPTPTPTPTPNMYILHRLLLCEKWHVSYYCKLYLVFYGYFFCLCRYFCYISTCNTVLNEVS